MSHDWVKVTAHEMALILRWIRVLRTQLLDCTVILPQGTATERQGPRGDINKEKERRIFGRLF